MDGLRETGEPRVAGPGQRFRTDAEWFDGDLGLDFGIVALSATSGG